MKIHNNRGIFDEQEVLDRLTKLGDPLVLINKHIDFEIFRKLLNTLFNRNDDLKATRGRPSYDVVRMLKIIFVQRLYNLSDDQIEFQITDRMSFRRFLEIPLSDSVPDCKTVWAFRESLKKEDYTDKLFDAFLAQLSKQNLIAKSGQMVDATIVGTPIQRNSKEDNETIKAGKTPASFTENPNKLAQKDMDARWTKKHNKSYFGYKNHVIADTKSKFITQYKVTDASVHDSQVCTEFLTDENQGEPFYGDSAYQTPEIIETLESLKMENKIVEKAYRNKPLTDEQKASNKEISQTRSRVEHIFGHMYNSMNDGMFIKTIGIERAKMIIGLNNLVYNMCRLIQLIKIAKA